MNETLQTDIKELNEKINKESAIIDMLMLEMNKVIVGQKHMSERLLVALLSNGHILLEGVPGLAKTLAISTLSKTIDAKFSRLQFTPDLLPADIIGTQIYSPKNEAFSVKKGPIFANFILADEINRAPAKVQSALLEAMQERQVTISGESFKLDDPFLVMATQNPVEQEGTYPLPEAQLDRFMFNLIITYPNNNEEISLELYEKIMSELASFDWQGGIVYSAFGEPLLHTKLIDLVLLTKRYLPDSFLEVVSNGDKLNVKVLDI